MTVIPFNPSRRTAPAAPPEAPSTPPGAARDVVARLEQTILLTLRENARNCARAEQAEAELAALRGARPPGPS